MGPDSLEFKNKQEMAWNKMAAGWNKWWQTFEEGGQAVSDHMINLANIGNGHRVLDVATGIGEPATTAAKVVGPDGFVVATDISEQMLSIGRDRIAKLGLNNIKFTKADAETLNLDEDPFDAILCRLALMLLPNLKSAAKSMYKNLKSGGKLVATVWPEPTKAPIVSIPAGVIKEMFNPPAPPKGTPGLFALANITPLKEALQEAGFNNIEIQSMIMNTSFDSAELYTKFMRDITPPINIQMGNISEEKITKIWNKVTEEAHKYEKNGKISMDNEITVIIATA